MSRYPSSLLTALAVAAGGVCLAQEAISPRLVEVDGLAMRVLLIESDDHVSGRPTVVFEGGGSAALETWDSVLPEVSRFATALAYDRAGTGESEWDGLPPTPERVASRLRQILTHLQLEPPYVLVGHSWGGALARYFVGFYPEDIAGVLYIDPTDITLSPAEEIAIFESIGAGAEQRDAFYQIQADAMSTAPAVLQAEAAVILDLMRAEPAERMIPVAPEVPSSVMVAGKPAVFPAGMLPFDTAAYAEATLQERPRRLRAWSGHGGQFSIVESGHMIHIEHPQLVVDAIRALVDFATD